MEAIAPAEDGLIVSEQVKAYTAGLLDGEGSVQINPTNPGKGRKCAYWGLQVRITSDCEEAISWLHTTWGTGSVGKSAKGRKRNKTTHYWTLFNRAAGLVLSQLLPYLIIKKSHAKVAIEFCKHTGFARGQLTEESSRTRCALAVQLGELNSKYRKWNPRKPRMEVR